MFREYTPAPRLAQYIETYWFSSIDGTDTPHMADCPMRILPDGCVDLLFNLSESGSHGLKPFAPHIVGTMTAWRDVGLDIDMMGIRFRPCAIAAFTRVPIYEFTDRRIEAGLFESLFDDLGGDELLELASDCERVAYLDKCLTGKLSGAYDIDRRVNMATTRILHKRGMVPIDRLMQDVCLCQRQFERKFKSMVGITPKMFSAITRFAHARTYLAQHPKQSLFQAAITCGYYDHSHLVRDFKRFSGVLPRQ